MAPRLKAGERGDAAGKLRAMQSSEPVHASYAGLGWHEQAAGIPQPARRWLTVTHSLTAAVRAVSTDFAVRRRLEAWRRPLRDEAEALGVLPHERVWTREVVLADGATPLVFAHTIAARRALPAWPWLRGLGDRPLGEVLFEHPGVSRRPHQFRRLDTRHPLYHSAARTLATAGPAAGAFLYARRSVFVLHGQRLLVTEVFLPSLLDRA
jgi:chorismate--pyruvate lyase